jgi:hypothetical protein
MAHNLVNLLNLSMTQVAFLRRAAGACKSVRKASFRTDLLDLFRKMASEHFFTEKVFYSVKVEAALNGILCA